mmetsp:Transcript_7647/g.16299  ORF Transcript_7647/g.16299 Transcript_7647/m.16299 type:complete len:303 (+) Transcript_7647:127-1035(+)
MMKLGFVLVVMMAVAAGLAAGAVEFCEYVANSECENIIGNPDACQTAEKGVCTDTTETAGITSSIRLECISGGARSSTYSTTDCTGQASVVEVTGAEGACIPLNDNSYTYSGCSTAAATATPTPTPTATATPAPTTSPGQGTETPTATATATATPGPSNLPEPTASPTPTPVCIDAEWITSNHAGFEVHDESSVQEVFCFGTLPCATAGHVVERRGELLTMAELCAEETCTVAEMRVNGVQHVRSTLMPCHGDVCLTTLDGWSNTIWKHLENKAVRFLLNTGNARIAERLTKIQMAAAARRQ